LLLKDLWKKGVAGVKEKRLSFGQPFKNFALRRRGAEGGISVELLII